MPGVPPKKQPPDWWDFAGRCTVAVHFLVSGAYLLLLSFGRTLANPGLRAFAWGIGGLGMLMLLTACLALQGRMRVPALAAGLLALVYLTADASMVESPADVRKLAVLRSVLILSAVWGLLRCLPEWRLRRRTMRAASCCLAVSAGALLPGYAELLAAGVAPWFEPVEITQELQPGDRTGLLQFRELEGRPVALDEPGVIYVLSYWATWCAPCRAELPDLAELQRELAGDSRARIFTVNRERRPAEDLRRFLEEHDLGSLPVLRDPREEGDRLGVRTLPTTLVVKDRTLLARRRGFDRNYRNWLRASIRRGADEDD